MTQDIIEMAKQAGLSNPLWIENDYAIIKAFAQLVEDAAFKRWAAQTKFAIQDEREACHALRQTLPNPHTNCQISAHAYDMAIVEYGRAIRARGEQQ
jgi:hypothetical protein